MQRSCDVCGAVYEAKRRSSMYCSTRCRTRASRRRAGAAVLPMKPQLAATEPAVLVGDVLSATQAVLHEAGRSDTPMGRAALALAARIDSRLDTGSALATAVRGLDEALKSALDGVASGGSLVSLKDRRARRNA